MVARTLMVQKFRLLHQLSLVVEIPLFIGYFSIHPNPTVVVVWDFWTIQQLWSFLDDEFPTIFQARKPTKLSRMMALLGSRGDENLLCFFPQKTEVELVWRQQQTGWWFQIFVIFTPYLGMISNLTHIFQMGWNHQLAKIRPSFCFARKKKRGNLREFGVHAQLPPWKLKAPGWPENIPKRKRRNISTQSRSFTLQKNYHPSDQWCFCLPNLNIHVHPQNSMWILKKSCFFFARIFSFSRGWFSGEPS